MAREVPGLWSCVAGGVKAGAGVQYVLHIPKEAEYRLKTVGMGKKFTCRLDDQGGWPLIAPGSDAELSETLRPGDYRYMTLPKDVDTRSRLTRSWIEPGVCSATSPYLARFAAEQLAVASH